MNLVCLDSGGSRIWVSTLKGGRQPIILAIFFPENCVKLEKLDWRATLATPGSPNVCSRSRLSLVINDSMDIDTSFFLSFEPSWILGYQHDFGSPLFSISKEKTGTHLATTHSRVTCMNTVDENESARSELNPDKCVTHRPFIIQMAKFMRNVLPGNAA